MTYFKPGFTWTLLNINNFGLRYLEKGGVYDGNGCMMFVDDNRELIFAYMNSKVFLYIAKMISSTMAWVIGNLKIVPYLRISRQNIVRREIYASA